jgi:hypothetical protein
MFYLLLSFGLLTLGAGVFGSAFGFPIRETTFGAALPISGMVGIVGGFILIGLAAAVQELRRVVQSVRRMPGPRPVRPVDRKDADRRPQPQRAAFPNRPGPDAPIPPPSSIDEPPFDDDSEVREAGVRIEARTDAVTPADQHAPERKPGPAWLRRAIAEIESVPRPVEVPAQMPAHPPPAEPLETRHYDEPQPSRRYLPDDEPQPVRRYSPEDEPQPVRRRPPAEPMSGRPGPEPMSGRPGPNPGERLPMQEGWVRPRAAIAPPAPAEPPEDFAPEPDPPPRQPSAPLPNIFDMVWTNDRRRPSSESAPPPEQRSEAPSHPPVRPLEPSPAPVVQSIPAPALPPPQEARPEPRAEPRPEPRPELRPEPRAEPRQEPRSEQRPAPRPLSILKSGVIDEMAYTLFTDGSIEAQMPDGTMRFSSIEELRRHLDQHDG